MTQPEIQSCEEALRMLAAFLDDELELAARNELERHLAVCRSCYSRAEFERALKARIADGVADVGSGFRTRLETMIRQFDVASSPD